MPACYYLDLNDAIKNLLIFFAYIWNWGND
jgi:hypothetical protein